MKRTRAFFVLIVFSFIAVAQPTYLQSAGVRLGHTSGLTYKKFLANEEAIEVIISGRNEGITLTSMYLFHAPMQFSFNENFYAFYGLGGHIGFEQYDQLNKKLVSYNPPDPPQFNYQEKNYYTMGIDAIVGLEYRWLTVPITIGFDVKPYYNFIGMRYSKAHFWDSAISFKYVF